MAQETKRRFDLAGFNVIIEVTDDFGNVSHHTIPLTGDKCHHCGTAMPGTTGAADVNASAAAIVANVDSLMPALIAKFAAAAQNDPTLLATIQAIQAKRNGK